MILIGDIGNTDTKICLLNSKHVIIKRLVLPTKKINKTSLFKKFSFIINKNYFINKSLFCSVVPNKFLLIKSFLQKNGVKYLIVGIGLNLVKSPNIKDYPTTNLYELTKTRISVNKMSKELIIIYKNFLKSQKVF